MDPPLFSGDRSSGEINLPSAIDRDIWWQTQLWLCPEYDIFCCHITIHLTWFYSVCIIPAISTH